MGLVDIFDYKTSKDKKVCILSRDDIKNGLVTVGGTSTPVALAICRAMDRSCHINRMGYVCDQWTCFALVSPKLYTLMRKWEEGGVILKPFIFDIIPVPEFNAYPGGVASVTKLEKTKRIFVPQVVKQALDARTPVVNRLAICHG